MWGPLWPSVDFLWISDRTEGRDRHSRPGGLWIACGRAVARLLMAPAPAVRGLWTAVDRPTAVPATSVSYRKSG